jgi:hypothetical protein
MNRDRLSPPFQCVTLFSLESCSLRNRLTLSTLYSHSLFDLLLLSFTGASLTTQEEGLSSPSIFCSSFARASLGTQEEGPGRRSELKTDMKTKMPTAEELEWLETHSLLPSSPSLSPPNANPVFFSQSVNPVSSPILYFFFHSNNR